MVTFHFLNLPWYWKICQSPFFSVTLMQRDLFTSVPPSLSLSCSSFSESLFTKVATRGVLLKKEFLKILYISQENTCALGLQLYEKRDSGTGVFLWILRNFQEHLFYWTPLDDCFFINMVDVHISIVIIAIIACFWFVLFAIE